MLLIYIGDNYQNIIDSLEELNKNCNDLKTALEESNDDDLKDIDQTANLAYMKNRLGNYFHDQFTLSDISDLKEGDILQYRSSFLIAY